MTRIRFCSGLLILASLLLVGCNDEEPSWPELEDPTACIDEYAPVCGVIPDQLHCITTPCPVGLYQTFSNSCYANTQGALTLFDGDCGTLEGELYYEETEGDCEQGNEPVCAAQTSPEPCYQARCPALLHTTFSSACEAREASASVLFDGECDQLEGSRVTYRQVLPCPPMEYPPVCALDAYESDVLTQDCLEGSCFTHFYRTHYTPCSVASSVATMVFERSCDELENIETTGEPPVEMVTDLPSTDALADIVEASIDGDLLTVILGYSGCSEQHFRLLMDPAFMESDPVQVRYSFQPVEEEYCDAYFETQFVYDLKPLKHVFQQAYQTDDGIVRLPGLVDYRF